MGWNLRAVGWNVESVEDICRVCDVLSYPRCGESQRRYKTSWGQIDGDAEEQSDVTWVSFLSITGQPTVRSIPFQNS